MNECKKKCGAQASCRYKMTNNQKHFERKR